MDGADKKLKRRALGNSIEERAAAFLNRAGLRLLRRNFHCRLGEIDLIAEDRQQTLIFIEVRYREGDAYGGAAASVGPGKQRRLRLTAAHFLQRHPRLATRPCRFDVVAVSPGQAGQLHFDWIIDAFH